MNIHSEDRLQKSPEAPGTERTMNVLEAVGGAPDGISASAIARQAGLSANAAHRITRTLESLGYLKRDPVCKQYSLSSRLLQIASPRIGGVDLVECANQPMRALRDETGETVLLNVLSGRHQVLIHQLSALVAPRITWDIGAQIELYSNAPGKVLLAFSRPDAQRELLAGQSFKGFTSHTITSRAALKRELEEVFRNGFALDRGELTEGIQCVAAPVFSAEDQLVASVCLSGPVFRVNADAVPGLALKTAACAEAIGVCLGRKKSNQ